MTPDPDAERLRWVEKSWDEDTDDDPTIEDPDQWGWWDER